jgi:hypothetical protein
MENNTSQILNFFSKNLSFLLFFGKLKRCSTGGVAGQNFKKKLTRSACAMFCAMGKFSNLKKFPPI